MTTDPRYTIRKALQTHLPKNNHYIVGVSGGSDSIALAYAMKDENYDFHAVIIDHQLQENSAQFSAYAQTLLTNYGIGSTIHKAHVHTDGKGIEDAARKARYDALFGYGENIVTGHTKNDQAETVILGLQQGSGPTALTGMKIISKHNKGTIFRPMLKNITKETTQKACESYGVKYWDDPHNQCDDYTRVRVRNTVLPTMSEQLNVNIVDKLASTAFMLQEERNFINTFTGNAYKECVKNDHVSIEKLAKHDPFIISNVITQFIKTHAGCVKKSWVETTCNLVTQYEGNKTIQVKGGNLIFKNKEIQWQPM